MAGAQTALALGDVGSIPKAEYPDASPLNGPFVMVT